MNTKCNKTGGSCDGEECTTAAFGSCPDAVAEEVPATPPYIIGGYPCTRDPKHTWPEYQPKED